MYVTQGHSPVPHRSHLDTTDPVRAAVRFPLQLPVRLRSANQEVSATTVDVSSTGILFTLSDYLPVGTELDWELRLPAEATGIAVDVSVVCRGRVAWVVDERPVRMAATIDRYRIEEKSQ